MPSVFTDKEKELIKFIVEGGNLNEDMGNEDLGAGFHTLQKRFYVIMEKIRWHEIDHYYLKEMGLATGDIEVIPDPRKVRKIK